MMSAPRLPWQCNKVTAWAAGFYYFSKSKPRTTRYTGTECSCVLESFIHSTPSRFHNKK